ncbi:MAG: hypothetical protein ACTSR2_13210 [Candidatus Hodarchaeales archaeon]
MVPTPSEVKKPQANSLQSILASLETSAQVRPETETYVNSLSKRLLRLTRDYYAILIFLFSNSLSFHQRLILMHLITIYPQGISGTDLARTLDISVQSKSIYRDLKLLKQQEFIRLNEVHSRLKLAYANIDNQMISRIIELVQIHGKHEEE